MQKFLFTTGPSRVIVKSLLKTSNASISTSMVFMITKWRIGDESINGTGIIAAKSKFKNISFLLKKGFFFSKSKICLNKYYMYRFTHHQDKLMALLSVPHNSIPESLISGQDVKVYQNVLETVWTAKDKYLNVGQLILFLVWFTV